MHTRNAIGVMGQDVIKIEQMETLSLIQYRT